MDEMFLTKLKDTLVSLETRLAAVEHTVNDVIINGLQEAATAYEDEERFNSFSDAYGPAISKYEAPMKVLCGDDFELCKELYEAIKSADGYGTEGFDEKGLMDAKLKEIADKIAAIKGIEGEAEKAEKDTEGEKDTESEKEESEDEGPSEEELAKEFKAYKD